MGLENKTQNWLQKYRDSINLIIGLLIGFIIILVFFLIRDAGREESAIPFLSSRKKMPVSVLPGPVREKEMVFQLDPDKSIKLTGMNDSRNERWSDIAGNFYSEKFVSSFDYEKGKAQVFVAIEERADTLRGRLEAKGLKPNFAYQIKLRGIFKYFECFEKIGYAGRWRFPGKATNYTDAEYRGKKDKSDVEAYIFFDFFVTDKNGNAIRDFALDSSLHVLWNGNRQGITAHSDDIISIAVDASDPKNYSRPKKQQNIELLWAERERGRYSSANQKRFLPIGKYIAELVLTEESFHSSDNDGGYWATVFKGEIEFTVE